MVRHRKPLTALVAAIGIAVVGLISGCTPPAGLAGTHFVIGQLNASATDPFTIRLVGLPPGPDVTVGATVVSGGVRWDSQAIYPVPPDGVLDLGTAHPALAAYPRPDATGLLWSLVGPPQSQSALERTWAIGPIDIGLVARENGRLVAQATIHRLGLADFATVRPIYSDDLLSTGIVNAPGGLAFDLTIGTYYHPDPPVAGQRPGVILIAGDEGGASAPFIAGQLARAGYPTLVVPAFGPEGQIPGSAALSVELFNAGLTWLGQQVIVDRSRIFTFGSWRAAPIALWLAAEEPSRIYGAIAASGPTTLLCAAADGSPILTVDGVGVPCEDATRTIADLSQIRLDRIPGPVILACGKADEVLPNACDWMESGVTIRGRHVGDAFIRAPGAGHAIAVPPLLPVELAALPASTAQATEAARVAFWSAVVGVLQASTRY